MPGGCSETAQAVSAMHSNAVIKALIFFILLDIDSAMAGSGLNVRGGIIAVCLSTIRADLSLVFIQTIFRSGADMSSSADDSSP